MMKQRLINEDSGRFKNLFSNVRKSNRDANGNLPSLNNR